jgi:hypothetical protein
LKRILAVADRYGIQVRLFVSPILPAYRAKLTDFDQWLDAVQDSLGPEYPVWDFSEAIGAREAFADRVHINDRGATLLLARMVSAGFLSSGAASEREYRRVQHNRPQANRNPCPVSTATRGNLSTSGGVNQSPPPCRWHWSEGSRPGYTASAPTSESSGSVDSM